MTSLSSSTIKRIGLVLLLALAIWLGSFVLYVRTLAPTVLPADSGEFQFAAFVLGLVHPTGYPLYLILGRIFAFLPFGDVAFRLNLMSAFWAATANSLVYLVALELWTGAAVGRSAGACPPPIPGRTETSAPTSPPVRRRGTSPRATDEGEAENLDDGRSGKQALTLTLSQGERGQDRSISQRERGQGRPIFQKDRGHRALAQLAAVAAAALFAVSDTFWSQAVIAEVYTLNAVFVALVLWLALRWSRGKMLLWPLALVFGLSLTHHHTMILLIPALLVFWVATMWPRWNSREKRLFPLPDRERVRVRVGSPEPAIDLQPGPLPEGTEVPPSPQRRREACGYDYGGQAPRLPGRGGWLMMVVLFLAPLLLYLYIPLRAPATSYLYVKVGDQNELVLYHNDLNGFLDMVSGRVFASKIKTGSEAHLNARWEIFTDLWQRQFGPVGLVLGLIGAAWLLLRRWRVGLLLLLSFATIVGFGLVYTIGDVYVMFIPAYLVYALFAGAAVFALGRLLRRLPWGLVWQVIPVAGGLALALYLAINGYAAHDMSRHWEYRQGWEQVLAQPLEQGALLATDDRDDIVPLWYFQQVEGRRRDLVGIFPGMVEAEEFSNVVRVIDHFGNSGRATYLIKPMAGLATKYQLAPAGLLTKVVGPALPGPPQTDLTVNFADRLMLSGYDLDADGTGPGNSVAPGGKIQVTLDWKVLARMPVNYTSFIHVADDTGKVVTQSDHQVGDVYYPSSLWRAGETIADQHELVLPSSAVPGTYELRVGIYYLPTLARLPIVGGGDIITIGHFIVK